MFTNNLRSMWKHRETKITSKEIEQNLRSISKDYALNRFDPKLIKIPIQKSCLEKKTLIELLKMANKLTKQLKKEE